MGGVGLDFLGEDVLFCHSAGEIRHFRVLIIRDGGGRSDGKTCNIRGKNAGMEGIFLPGGKNFQLFLFRIDKRMRKVSAPLAGVIQGQVGDAVLHQHARPGAALGENAGHLTQADGSHIVFIQFVFVDGSQFPLHEFPLQLCGLGKGVKSVSPVVHADSRRHTGIKMLIRHTSLSPFSKDLLWITLHSESSVPGYWWNH